MKTFPLLAVAAFPLLFGFQAPAAPGEVDPSFNAGSILESTPLAMVRQTDGKLVIGGRFATVPGLVRKNIARLTNDGLGDPTFDAGIGPDDAVWAMALQPDGKIVIGGDFAHVNGVSRKRLARLF